MIEFKLKRHLLAKSHTVVLFDSIENMPIHLFSKMQKYQMIESGIGKNMDEFDRHFETTIKYLKHDKKDKAIGQLKIMRHLFNHNMSEVDPSHLAFCCTVFSIDGEEITDHSEQSLEKIRKRLSKMGLTSKILADKAEKKN